MTFISKVLSAIPLLRHRDTVVTIADQDDFVTKYEATNDALATDTVPDINTLVSQFNVLAQEINVIYQSIAAASGTGYSQDYINRALFEAYYEYTASGGETQFNVGDNSNVIIYKNDIKLTLTTDYTLNADGINIDFVTPLIVSDFVQSYDLKKISVLLDLKQNKSTLGNDWATKLHSSTAETTLGDADEFGIWESVTGLLYKVSWSTIKSNLVIYLDTLYATLISPAFTGTPTLNSEPLFVSNSISITGTLTATNATNTLKIDGLSSSQMADIAKTEIGDVIKILNSTLNDELYTAEVLTQQWTNGDTIAINDLRKQISDNVTYIATSAGTTSGTDISDDTGVTWAISTYEEIIVNQAHAGKSRTIAPIGEKALIDEASTANVTISIFSKWYNSTIGLGQGLVDLTASKSVGATYTNITNRTIHVSAAVQGASRIDLTAGNIKIDEIYIGAASEPVPVQGPIRSGQSYIINQTLGATALRYYTELR